MTTATLSNTYFPPTLRSMMRTDGNEKGQNVWAATASLLSGRQEGRAAQPRGGSVGQRARSFCSAPIRLNSPFPGLRGANRD